jgi:hypothetical protein
VDARLFKMAVKAESGESLGQGGNERLVGQVRSVDDLLAGESVVECIRRGVRISPLADMPMASTSDGIFMRPAGGVTGSGDPRRVICLFA